MKWLKEFFGENFKLFVATKALFITSFIGSVVASMSTNAFLEFFFGFIMVVCGIGAVIMMIALFIKMFAPDAEF